VAIGQVGIVQKPNKRPKNAVGKEKFAVFLCHKTERNDYMNITIKESLPQRQTAQRIIGHIE
jgi:hypothetical protein